MESLEGELAGVVLNQPASGLPPDKLLSLGSKISQNNTLSGSCWETVADRLNYNAQQRQEFKNQVRAQQKLEGVLLLEDWVVNDEPSHTLFVLKSALEHCNRPDIMMEFKTAVEEIMKVELLVAIHYSNNILDTERRVHCMKEMTNGEASLRQSLENRLDGDIRSYEITSPKGVRWTTLAKELKGQQLTLTKIHRFDDQTYNKTVVEMMEESAIMDSHVSSTNAPAFVPNIEPDSYKPGNLSPTPRPCYNQVKSEHLNVFERQLSMATTDDNLDVNSEYYKMNNSNQDIYGQEEYVSPDERFFSYENILHQQGLIHESNGQLWSSTGSVTSIGPRPPGSCGTLTSQDTVPSGCLGSQVHNHQLAAQRWVCQRRDSQTDRKRHLSENSDDELPLRKSPPHSYLSLMNSPDADQLDNPWSPVPGLVKHEAMPVVEDYLNPDSDIPPPLPPKTLSGTNQNVMSQAMNQWPGKRLDVRLFIPRAAIQLDEAKVPGWHGLLSMEKMEEMMSVVLNEDGNYIVWRYEGVSEQDNKLVLTVTHMRQLLHYNIRARVAHGYIVHYYLFKKVYFTPRITELVQYYKDHELLIKSDMHGTNARARHVRLCYPVLRGY